ncbi:MAG: hypothetical protein Q9211_003419 [Gyalolechia sp. 1 TL-2023]
MRRPIAGTKQIPFLLRAYSTRSDRHHPASTAPDTPSNPAIFPGLTFALPSASPDPQNWAIVGPSSTGKTTFLEILRGQHLCIPPTARSFPFLASPEIERKDHRLRIPFRAIQYVGHAGKYAGGLRSGNTAGAYLSARYESRREATDFTVRDYLTDNVHLNPTETGKGISRNNAALKRVITDLDLGALVRMPVDNLSNGQIRRAKIAKALLDKPEVLLLDEPFMGLDPPTRETLSPLLHNLAEAQAPRIILSLRPQDPLPEWITHVVVLDPELRVAYQGIKKEAPIKGQKRASKRWRTPSTPFSRDGLPLYDEAPPSLGEPIIQMHDVVVRYGDRTVLGNWQETDDGEVRHGLHWTVRRGERWGVFGPNGSGKTTLLSLICSDHPQSYSLPITLFSRPRLPRPGTPGISIFDLQSRIGHSSPEIHNFFPKSLSLRRTIESAWSDTFLSPPNLTYERDELVDTYLKWFEPDLNPHFQRPETIPRIDQPGRINRLGHGKQTLDFDNSTDWAGTLAFASLPFSGQRLALFLRALIKKPDLVVLDEAFSGMDAALRDKCLLFLTWGTNKVFSRSMVDATNRSIRYRDVPELIFSRGRLERVQGLEERQALIVVSHVAEEVPGVVRDWLCLPEAAGAEQARFGRLDCPLEGVEGGWERIWDGTSKGTKGRDGR